MTSFSFPIPEPPTINPGPGWFQSIYRVVLNLTNGKMNATGSVTLTASVATTTLTDARIGGSSVILFSPTTANAAGALGGLYVSAKAKGSATLTHASTATTDRTFDYVVIG